MSVHVTVGVHGGGPVAIKSATTPDEIDRLAAEIERLNQARHPGVVELVGSGRAGAGVELRTRYAGEPVERWRGTLPEAAGVCVAVAATLADLHDIGLVHGRIDASHVLLGADGRPRLCGLRGTVATPADDVEALGRLMKLLVDRAGDDRRPLAWPWAPTAARRALSRVIDWALDPVPTRRPSARSLARAVLAGVPGAGLPSTLGGDDPGAARPTAHGDRTGHRGTGPSDPAIDERDGAGGAESSGGEDVGTSGHGWTQLDLPDVGVPDASDLSDLPGPSDLPAGDDPGVPHRDPTAPGAVVSAATGWDDEVDGDETPDPVEDPDFWDEVPTRPTTPVAAQGRRAAGARLTALRVSSIAGVGLALLAGGVAAARSNGAGHEPTAAPARAADEAVEPPAGDPPCPTVPPPAVDRDGDGCPETLRIDGHTVEIDDARWSLGRPGDVVAVGDWDCDGTASPALLRPATGDVFVFAGWAGPDDPMTVPARDRIPGAVSLRARPEPQGCDALVVEQGAGAAAPVETVIDAGG